MTRWLLKTNKWRYYIVLCGIYVLFTFLVKHFLFTDHLLYASLEEQYTAEQIQRILHINHSWQYIGYLFIPVIIIVRTLYTSFCLYLGDLVQETKWKFRSLFNISLKADIVFGLSSISNFYYYVLTDDFNTMEDLNVNCFSLLKIVGRAGIPEWLILAFNSLNLFELAYIILLILFIKASFNLNYLKSTLFVIFTYGIGNYLYLTAMTFLYLNLA